jgi:hypothetical protein
MEDVALLPTNVSALKDGQVWIAQSRFAKNLAQLVNCAWRQISALASRGTKEQTASSPHAFRSAKMAVIALLLTLAVVYQVGLIQIVLRQFVNRHVAMEVTAQGLIHVNAPQIGVGQTAESRCVNKLVKTELAVSPRIHAYVHQVGADIDGRTNCNKLW